MTDTSSHRPDFPLLVPAASEPPSCVAEVIDAEVVRAPTFSLRDLLRLVQRHRRLALACFAGSLGITAFALLFWPRSYTATMKLHISRQSPIQLRLDDNVLRVDENDRTVNGSSVFLSTQVEALQSRDLAERVIRRYGLADQDAFLHPRGNGLASWLRLPRLALRPGPTAVEALGRPSSRLLAMPIPAVFRPRGWNELGPADPATGDARPIDPELLDQYAAYLQVRDVRGTDLVEIRVTTPRPDLSALLAAAHAEAYVDAVEAARNATNATAGGFLDTQLQTSHEAVERAEAALQEFAEQNPDVALNQEGQLMTKKVELLGAELSQAEAARIDVQALLETLTKPAADASPYFLDQPGVQKLTQALQETQAQRAALDPRLGPNHPQMRELQGQESALARQLANEFRQQLASVRSRYEAARRREDTLRHKLASEQQALVELRGRGLRYDFLRGEVQTARTLHESLLKQNEQTAVNSALAASNVRLVERAEVPVRASSPKLLLFGTVGLLLSLVAGAGAPLARELLDDSVRSTDEVQGLLGIPTMATIPTDAAPPMLMTQPASVTAEAFRHLRTAILSARVRPRIILVSSAIAGEGKTQVSTNLVAALAETGARTLLVDADMRKPECHRILGVDCTRGLSSLLAGDASVGDVIQRLPGAAAFVMPAGPAVANASALLCSPRMREILATLAATFEFVVLDTPPVLPVADAAMLAREADGIVLVVKGQDTPRGLVRRARDQLLQAGGRLLGTVVNQVDPRWDEFDAYVRSYSPYGRTAESNG